MSRVLAVDIGTTAMKAVVVENAQKTIAVQERSYPMMMRGEQREIDTDHWWSAFLDCCRSLSPHLRDVQAVNFSASTPGTTALGPDGEALSPAVVFLDGRSKQQAQFIIDTIGENELLRHTSNLPASGGATAATLLWWKENQPDLFEQTAIFGHTNTLFAKRLTGEWGMDPSTASLTALYNTTANDGTWNEAIAQRLGIPLSKLPPIVNSWEPVGQLQKTIAKQTGLPAAIPVLMGGNDAMCAALNGGVTQEGAVLDICGTCEVLCVGLARAIPSVGYNIRCHVIPNLWSTLYVLNTGGKALEWFQQNFCCEMDAGAFYNEYIPKVINEYFEQNEAWDLPDYEVFLAGDRYSTQEKHAAFTRLTLDTTREKMLMALIKANTRYMARHLEAIEPHVVLSHKIHLTGGGVSEAFIRCKKRWMGDYQYELRSNSSVMGAAQLAHDYLTNSDILKPHTPVTPIK